MIEHSRGTNYFVYIPVELAKNVLKWRKGDLIDYEIKHDSNKEPVLELKKRQDKEKC